MLGLVLGLGLGLGYGLGYDLPLEDKTQRRHVLHEVDVAVLGEGHGRLSPLCLGPAPAPPSEPPGPQDTLSPGPDPRPAPLAPTSLRPPERPL